MEINQIIIKECEGFCFSPCKNLSNYVPFYVIAIILLILALLVLYLGFKRIKDTIKGNLGEK